VRLTTQQLTARARALVSRCVPPDELIEAVEAAIAEAGEPAARTLVVTDALAALGELRALGVGVEHLPAADRGRRNGGRDTRRSCGTA
jgi:hypothetical protein